MPRGKERDLAFGVEVRGVEPGEVVERPVHQCHVSAPVTQGPCLLADLTQEDLDGAAPGSLASASRSRCSSSWEAPAFVTSTSGRFGSAARRVRRAADVASP
ncbi:hypothetical protein GCM10010390_52260 [Streptomyces mordarskii]|uniref:Uncharacterized protein n=1 Tax=Streptomyces mordarskii TaxID=1226758 RepID=A0ABN1DHG2_9ACTN